MDKTLNPVFVVGCPRSGTTLVGSLLGSHAELIAIPEAQFLIDVARTGASGADLSTRVRAHPSFRIWELANPPALSDDAGVPELMRAWVGAYAAQTGCPEAVFWVDHTPEHVRHAHTLSEMFPESRWIHVLRDGRGVTASVLDLDWGPNTAFAAASWWAEHVACGLALEQSLGGRAKRVRFEDLTLEPEREMRALCEFLEIAFEPTMLDGRGFRVPEFTRSQHALVGRQPDARRADAWRKSLSRRSIEVFEAVTGELLAYLGYTPVFGLRARPLGFAAKAVWAAADLALRPVNKLRFARRRRAAMRDEPPKA